MPNLHSQESKNREVAPSEMNCFNKILKGGTFLVQLGILLALSVASLVISSNYHCLGTPGLIKFQQGVVWWSWCNLSCRFWTSFTFRTTRTINRANYSPRSSTSFNCVSLCCRSTGLGGGESVDQRDTSRYAAISESGMRQRLPRSIFLRHDHFVRELDRGRRWIYLFGHVVYASSTGTVCKTPQEE